MIGVERSLTVRSLVEEISYIDLRQDEAGEFYPTPDRYVVRYAPDLQDTFDRIIRMSKMVSIDSNTVNPLILYKFIGEVEPSYNGGQWDVEGVYGQ